MKEYRFLSKYLNHKSKNIKHKQYIKSIKLEQTLFLFNLEIFRKQIHKICYKHI